MDPAIVAVEMGLRGKTGVKIKMLEIFGSKLPHLYARDHPPKPAVPKDGSITLLSLEITLRQERNGDFDRAL